MPGGRAFAPDNYSAPGPIPASVHRTAVLPLYSSTWAPNDLAPLENALLAELAKVERFEVSPVTRSTLHASFGQEAFLSSTALPADLLPRLADNLAVDAVLLLDLTHYSPYQPLAIGIRAKLVAVADGRVLWSFDSIFDSANPGVAKAARQYHAADSRPAYPLESSAGILQSPSRFAKYVAHAMFETLPSRQTP